MLKPVRLIIGALALALGLVSPVLAADIYEPPVIEYQPPAPIYEAGGWYIRGDIDYHSPKLRGTEYITYGCCDPEPGTNTFDSTSLKGALSLGAGVGYQVNRYFRTDLTGDYWFKSKFRGSTSGSCGGNPCVSEDESDLSALLLLANAYVDLGTYYGVTPYVGAGLGGAHVRWGDLRNTTGSGTDIHKGTSGWRFAYAVMAGASYCITHNLQADLGYRYSRIEGGRMFEEYSPSGESIGVGPGFDKGINTHEVRGGLRWSFGGNANCAPEQIAFQPEPVYQPVYK
jgi:opacity protein-like surface antigen